MRRSAMNDLGKHLTTFEIELLANLPIEPIGLSLDELADGLLENRGPRATGRIRRALDAIVAVLGGLYAPIGDDELGNCGVLLYGIRLRDVARVRRFFRKPAQRDVYR